MEWPPLGVLVITYNRVEVLQETLRRLDQHLDYAGPRQLFIADDGSDDGTQAWLAETHPDATLVQSQRAGLGGNANAGLRAAFGYSDLVFQLQDDLWLTRHFDLHPHVQRLIADETAGYIRLWGAGGHKYEGRLEGEHWRIYWHSDELYIPSDRPHLKHWRFHRHFGFYPEGLSTAVTEDAWCHQCKNLAGSNGVTCDVLVPHAVDIERNFEHAGWHTRWRDRGL